MKTIRSEKKEVISGVIETSMGLFNSIANKGKSVLIILKNENVKTGMLLGITQQSTVMLELRPLHGNAYVLETPFSEINDIIFIDE
jgi:archaellum biogenesis ATPase FlaH